MEAMEWQQTPYVIPLAWSGAVAAISGLYILWRHRHLAAGRTAALYLLAAVIWLLAYSLELAGGDEATKVFWAKVEYLGIVMAPTTWLIFTLQYIGQEKWLTRRRAGLLAIMPILTLLFVFTNEHHHLFWSHVTPNMSGPVLTLHFGHGPWFWVHLPYSCTLVLLGSLLLIQMHIHSYRLYRWQVIAMLFAAFVPALEAGVELTELLSPWQHFSLTSVAFTIGSLAVAWAIFRLPRGEIVSVAREAVIKAMGDGVIVLDAQNRIVDLNPAAQRLIGYSSSEVMAQPLEKIWPEWRSQMERRPDEDRMGGQVVVSQGNGQRTYDLRISPLLDWRGRLMIQVVVLRDITERRRMEEALREYSERLEEMVEQRTRELREAQEELIRREKLALLGALAGGVGHELRNPLGVISNAVYYLKLVLAEADETTREYLEMISSEVDSAERIVSDLLNMSRTRPAERGDIEVFELVGGVLEKEAPPESVEVSLELAPELRPLFVDGRQMGQVLRNLVINAYEAMPEGGKLTIRAKDEAGWIYLSVEDTGRGIPKQNMERIFEPLFTTKPRGIGLGLAVSKNLTEVNGGRIEMKSEEGKGSTFTLILPTRDRVQ